MDSEDSHIDIPSQISDLTLSQNSPESQNSQSALDYNNAIEITLERKLTERYASSSIIAIKTSQPASQSDSVASQSVASQSVASQSSCNSFDNILHDLAALSDQSHGFRDKSNSVSSWGTSWGTSWRANESASQPEDELNSDSVFRQDDNATRWSASQPEDKLNSDSVFRQDDDDATVGSILSKTESIASIVSLHAIFMYFITHGCFEQVYKNDTKLYTRLTYRSQNTKCTRVSAVGTVEWENAPEQMVHATSRFGLNQIFKETQHKQCVPCGKLVTEPNQHLLRAEKVYGPNRSSNIQDIDKSGNYIGLLLQSVTKTLDQLFDESIFLDVNYRNYCITIFTEAFYPNVQINLENNSHYKTILTISANTNLLGNDQFNLFCYLWTYKDTDETDETRREIQLKTLLDIRGRKYGELNSTSLPDLSTSKRKREDIQDIQDIQFVNKRFFNLSSDKRPSDERECADLNGYALDIPTYTWPAFRQLFSTNSLMKNEYGELLISLQIWPRVLESQVLCFLRDPEHQSVVIDMACSNPYTKTGEDITEYAASQIHPEPPISLDGGNGEKNNLIRQKQSRKQKKVQRIKESTKKVQRINKETTKQKNQEKPRKTKKNQEKPRKTKKNQKTKKQRNKETKKQRKSPKIQ